MDAAKNELAQVYKEATELNEFETPFVPQVAAPLLWSIEKYKVAEMMACSGKTKKQIAKELNLPLGVVNKWCENSQFMEEVYRISQDYLKTMKQDNQMFLSQIIAARRAQAETAGYADASKKDTVEIIAEMRKERGEDSSQQTNYTGLLENLLKHSIASPHRIVEIGDK